MNAQAKSELNITTLLLPEHYKLSPYYETLSSEMDEKQKALAMRWWLERIRTNRDKSNAINRRTDLKRYSSDLSLHRILYHYYGRLNKREIYTCSEILYSIWDSYDGYYDDVVSNLLKEYKTLFTTSRKADAIIQRLINKGIVSCKIYFRESGTDRILKPKRILSLSKDVEIAAMSDLTHTNEKDMSAHDPVYDDYLLYFQTWLTKRCTNMVDTFVLF
jgi:predicted transcriptional regulator